MSDSDNFENLPKKDRDSFWTEQLNKKLGRKKHGVDSMDTKQGYYSRKWSERNKKPDGK